MKRVILIVGSVISILITLSSHVMAQRGGISLGKSKIFPGITLEERYNDNIFLGNGTNDTTELKESDWITLVKPRIGYNYLFPGRGSMSMGYKGIFAFYRTNDENDWRNHQGLFDLDYRAPGGPLLGINYVYTDAEDPFGNLAQFNTGIKTKRQVHALRSKTGYQFENGSEILGYYNYYKQEYDLERDFTQNYDVNEIGLGFQRRLFQKTWGFVRYHVGERDYFTHPPGSGVTESNDADFRDHRINTGLTWDPGGKLSGELNFGYLWVKFKNLFDVNGDRYEDGNTWIAGTHINYTISPVTALAFSLTRVPRYRGSNTNTVFADTGIGLNLRQILLAKLSLTAGASYSKNDYNQPVVNPREDDNYRANIGLTYQVRYWLTTGVGYTYWEKNSNFEEYDFTNNQVLVSLSAEY
jgi:hypothetical protein